MIQLGGYDGSTARRQLVDVLRRYGLRGRSSLSSSRSQSPARVAWARDVNGGKHNGYYSPSPSHRCDVRCEREAVG